MKLNWFLFLGLLLMFGCSMSEAEAERRVGLWERHPEFQSCIRQAVPEQADYDEVYKACLNLDGEDTQAMQCVKDQTPLEDLGQVKLCQRQLHDLVAYGDPKQSSYSGPSGDWAGPEIGFFMSVF